MWEGLEDINYSKNVATYKVFLELEIEKLENFIKEQKSIDDNKSIASIKECFLSFYYDVSGGNFVENNSPSM